LSTKVCACVGEGGGGDDFRTPNIIVEALRSYPTNSHRMPYEI
jgi:hypothetical protein